MSNLLQLQRGVKKFGARHLFDDASFSVNEGEKVGVIGPNGAGKSTLFRILIGQDSLDEGDITRRNGLTVGYLAQEDAWAPGILVEEYLASQHATPIWQLKQLAPQFGLKLTDFDGPVMDLSGGYRMRVKLLYLLASRPDLMLLDEPTNYLDLETLVVLENFLIETKSAFLLISHDREFLRRVTDHVLEVEAGQLTKFAGNIDDYFEQKAMLREQLERQALSAEAKRREVLDFAARFGAKASKAKQVQSRLKRLDAMESIELKSLPLAAQIRLPEPVKTARLVLALRESVLGYGAKRVLTHLNFDLERGDHLGVVGRNGAGKTTLLKAMAGELMPLEGEVVRGSQVEIAYYAQHVVEHLSAEQTVLDAMWESAHSDVGRQDALDLAGSLLFRGDDVKKKIRVLSGGEKSRVALGRMLLRRASLLILDEPTNHLDFHTVEALTQALADYQGAVVIVSHDRGFVRRAATKILEIRDGRAEFYPGTYDEYVWSVQKGALAERRSSEAIESPSVNKQVRVDFGSSVSTSLQSEAKFNFKERKKQLERIRKLSEKELADLDVTLTTAQQSMIDLNEALLTSSREQASDLARKIADLQVLIEKSESRYLEVLTELEATARERESLES